MYEINKIYIIQRIFRLSYTLGNATERMSTLINTYRRSETLIEKTSLFIKFVNNVFFYSQICVQRCLDIRKYAREGAQEASECSETIQSAQKDSKTLLVKTLFFLHFHENHVLYVFFFPNMYVQLLRDAQTRSQRYSRGF